MSDLISRSALIESWCEENCGNRRCVDTFDKCTFVLHAKNQPTAYDLDKVVEMLEEEKGKYENLMRNPHIQGIEHVRYASTMHGIKEVIDIVRAGGKE